MTITVFLGAAAAVLTTAAYVPQAYKTISTRSTASLSLPTYLLLFAGTCLWAAYGFVLANLPIILANVITALLAGIILVLKLTARPSEEPVAEGGHPTK